MPPIRYNMPELARAFMNIRAIPLHPDVNTLIAINYASIMGAIAIDEFLDAQLIFASSCTLTILTLDIQLFAAFEFYDLLRRASTHNYNHCMDTFSRFSIKSYDDNFVIDIQYCDCADDELYQECSDTEFILPYAGAKTLLRIVYDNSLILKHYVNSDFGYQLFDQYL